ncbi:hypothetical protein MSKU15_0111 [Komagataeibacter diospyri]|nr:hypothetical protein MSKU15_0111 [Komagataeibacter diospyri]
MALHGVWRAMSPVATDRCVATGLVVGPLVMVTLFSPLIKGSRCGNGQAGSYRLFMTASGPVPKLTQRVETSRN